MRLLIGARHTDTVQPQKQKKASVDPPATRSNASSLISSIGAGGMTK